jgi:hypothetical protein
VEVLASHGALVRFLRAGERRLLEYDLVLTRMCSAVITSGVENSFTRAL